MQAKAPACQKCRHFKITWDPHFPRSCQLFGIKTNRIPSWDVFAAPGKHCPSFEKNEDLKE